LKLGSQAPYERAAADLVVSAISWIAPALDTALSTKAAWNHWLQRYRTLRTHTDPFGNQVRNLRREQRWILLNPPLPKLRGFARCAAPRHRLGRAYRMRMWSCRVAKRETDPHGGAVGPAPAHRRRVSAFGVDPDAAIFTGLELMGPAAGSPGGFGPWVPGRGRPQERGWVESPSCAAVGDPSRTTFRFSLTINLGWRSVIVSVCATRQLCRPWPWHFKPIPGAPAGFQPVYMSTTLCFVDAWLLRACAKLGVRLVHSGAADPRPGQMKTNSFVTVREHFLIEVPTRHQDLPPSGSITRLRCWRLNRCSGVVWRPITPPHHTGSTGGRFRWPAGRLLGAVGARNQPSMRRP